MFEIVFLSGARAGAVIPISGTMVAGRSPDCEVEVPDPNASRHHARIEWDGTRLRVVDNGSSNGTHINEQRLGESLLRNGDILRLGETRMRIQRRTQRSSGGPGSTSVFGFKEAAGDLSQSLSLSVLQSPFANVEDIGAIRSRLQAIMKVAEDLTTLTKLEDIYGPVLDTLMDVFPQAERAFLLLGEEYDHLQPKAVRQRRSDGKDNLTVSSTLCKAALTRKEIIAWTDGGNTDFDQGMSLVSLNLRSAMAIPLMVKDEVLGVVVIDTTDRRRSFTQSDLDLAFAVCRQVAISLKNAMLVTQVERETTVRNNLSRFLPRSVVDQAVDGKLDLRLGGTTANGTVFFADVVGFTRMSEEMSPEDVIAMMNGFFNRMVPLIEAEGGAIDKFMGDCIMAVWGIPFETQKAPFQACLAGLQMQNALAGLNSQARVDGAREIGMGVGMESGTMVAGNIGSEDRVEYTVLGNIVNTASRIQALAGRQQVLVGELAWKGLDGAGRAIRMPPVTVKNKAAAITTFSVRGLAVEGGEMVLHVPVRLSGDSVALLVRRLSDGTFILLHDGDQEPGTELRLDIAELTAADPVTFTVETRLPQQAIDGVLARSLIALDDSDLGGLLAGDPITATRTWDQLGRS